MTPYIMRVRGRDVALEVAAQMMRPTVAPLDGNLAAQAARFAVKLRLKYVRKQTAQ
ncbi:MAG: hypothetical protein JO307_06615 [Bryobacterales bacterium]|nr:hypothetical protein [Bryobacterales bacterium]MBV9400718.1 hypothetical protein [Bryobacterales bacterium]